MKRMYFLIVLLAFVSLNLIAQHKSNTILEKIVTLNN